MQLNVSTDYAIRIIVYLAEKNRMVSSSELSDNVGVKGNYILKLMKKLENEGLVMSSRGKDGGFILARKSESISLLELVTLMEPTIKLNRCLEKDHYCSRYQNGECQTHDFYVYIQSVLETELKKVSIQDLIDKNFCLLNMCYEKKDSRAETEKIGD